MSIDITNPIFHDEEKARAHLEEQRWPDGPVCPHCGSQEAGTVERKVIAPKKPPKGKKYRPQRAGLYYCGKCEEQFTVTVGTVMESSHLPLHKWVLAIQLMAASKKGMSSKQIQRMLGVTYKTAWFIMHRIREAMTPALKTSGPLGGKGKVVESDETFVGGKAKNAKKGKPTPKKQPVVTLIERGGEMRAKHVADVTAKTVRNVLVTQVSRKSHLMTDDSLLYYWMGREFAAHDSVNHSKDEYVRGKAHVNTAESFFAILKRGIMGSFHSVSEAHLQRYVNEFAFRWNHRAALDIDDCARANAIIKGAEGKRLTYRRPDGA